MKKAVHYFSTGHQFGGTSSYDAGATGGKNVFLDYYFDEI